MPSEDLRYSQDVFEVRKLIMRRWRVRLSPLASKLWTTLAALNTDLTRFTPRPLRAQHLGGVMGMRGIDADSGAGLK